MTWFRAITLVGLLALGELSSIAAQSAPPAPVKQARFVMGTLCEIVANPSDGSTQSREQTEMAVGGAFEELKRLDAMLSNWKPDSELMRMNREAGAAVAKGNPRPRVRVRAELFERIAVALQIASQTGGAFDPTVGPLVRAWGFLPRCAQDADCLPRRVSGSEVAAAARKVGWRKVRLDRAARTVEFAEEGVEIDLGGIAKGYAAARAAQVLRDHGIPSALVSLGGSSMVAIGAPETAGCAAEEKVCGQGWPIEIRDPRAGFPPVARLILRDGEALATSGTYEKRIGKGSRRRSHIINPVTGKAMSGFSGVTVVMPDAETADAITKPFLLLQNVASAKAMEILKEFPDAGVILTTIRRGRAETRSAGRQSYGFRLLAVEHNHQ